MNKKYLIIIVLLLIAIAAIPLAFVLFPWAQSVSAVELSDGTKAITSPTAGSWITKVCGGISIVSFISAILVGVFYNPKNNDSSA